MKVYVASLLLIGLPAVFASFSPGIETILYKLEDDCSKESGLDAAAVEKIRKNQEVPDEETANKWAKCMMQKHNVIKTDGTINMEVKTISIPADTDTVRRAFPKCSALAGRDLDDTARLMMNCYWSNSEGLLMAFRKRPTTA